MMYDVIAPLVAIAIAAIAVSVFIMWARRDTVPEPFAAEHVLDEVYDEDEAYEDDFLNFLIESDQI